MCEQEGRVGLVAVVDHIKPAKEFPELFWERKNWQGLCEYHDGIKQRMEILARKTGQLDLLPLWCSSVEARPREIQIAPQA
jgi:5-methylcytosine-specific restriction endonuclease McrA